MSGYNGPVALEGALAKVVLVATTGSAPTAATALPTYAIYGSAFSTPIEQGTTHKNNDLASIVGAYGINQTLRASSGFAAGEHYSALVDYNMKNGDARRQSFSTNAQITTNFAPE